MIAYDLFIAIARRTGARQFIRFAVRAASFAAAARAIAAWCISHDCEIVPERLIPHDDFDRCMLDDVAGDGPAVRMRRFAVICRVPLVGEHVEIVHAPGPWAAHMIVASRVPGSHSFKVAEQPASTLPPPAEQVAL